MTSARVDPVRSVLLVLVLALTPVACSSQTTSSVPDPVSATEAREVVAAIADVSADRSSQSADEVCTTLAVNCTGLSSGWRADPTSAPTTPPTVLCDVSAGDDQFLVVSGKDARGRPYVGQVMVQRKDGRAVAHEPAYWLGIRYTQLLPALAWSGTGDEPASRARQVERMTEVCADPAAWVASVS